MLVELLPLINRRTNGIKILCDSQGGIKLSENDYIDRQSKYTDAYFHFVRDVVANENVQLEYIYTKEIDADVITTSLGRIRYEYF